LLDGLLDGLALEGASKTRRFRLLQVPPIVPFVVGTP
jgi:hypothetical protein